MRSKYIRRIGILCALFLILTATAIGLVYSGVVLLNNPSESEYPVRGVDVSAYQGTVDWQTLSAQGIDFAFIKATEGSSFVDSCFAYNCAEAQKQSLSVGDIISSAMTAAENRRRSTILIPYPLLTGCSRR